MIRPYYGIVLLIYYSAILWNSYVYITQIICQNVDNFKKITKIIINSAGIS
jgi:hypothetical protein